jgi:hypothetical protein
VREGTLVFGLRNYGRRHTPRSCQQNQQKRTEITKKYRKFPVSVPFVFFCKFHGNSEWYRAHWDACGTNSNPGECRAELSRAYQEQQKLLLDVLAAMNGKPKAQQKQMLQQMRLTAPPLPK